MASSIGLATESANWVTGETDIESWLRIEIESVDRPFTETGISGISPDFWFSWPNEERATKNNIFVSRFFIKTTVYKIRTHLLFGLQKYK